jgi:glycosyltransferase involved in cell wall biosynthesis
MFTYIIGYRHRPDRLRLLRRTLDWLNSFSGVEILLIEQDTHSKISHLNLNCKHIFVESDKPYNRSWSFNIGLKHATTNIIVCGDSDLIMRPKDLITALKKTEEFDMVNPYKSVIDLTPQESNLPLNQIIEIDRPGRGELDHQKTNICGGIAIFRKDALIKIGGWDENFWGWGGEDDIQTIKTENFLSHTTMDYRSYHLYHDRTMPNQELYKRNLMILEKVSKFDKNQLVSMINKSSVGIGMKNKCV